mmetsp:Transcript_86575/g.158022  ORF Transcript_86575/g.158022 Transcript_86575/m.158022 type:complete len:351 (+) Transcript_86575:51-1103(+)
MPPQPLRLPRLPVKLAPVCLAHLPPLPTCSSQPRQRQQEPFQRPPPVLLPPLPIRPQPPPLPLQQPLLLQQLPQLVVLPLVRALPLLQAPPLLLSVQPHRLEVVQPPLLGSEKPPLPILQRLPPGLLVLRWLSRLALRQPPLLAQPARQQRQELPVPEAQRSPQLARKLAPALQAVQLPPAMEVASSPLRVQLLPAPPALSRSHAAPPARVRKASQQGLRPWCQCWRRPQQHLPKWHCRRPLLHRQRLQQHSPCFPQLQLPQRQLRRQQQRRQQQHPRPLQLQLRHLHDALELRDLPARLQEQLHSGQALILQQQLLLQGAALLLVSPGFSLPAFPVPSLVVEQTLPQVQ